MSSSLHVDNNKKYILILGKGPTQGLEHTLTAQKMYSITFIVTKKKFCLSLHYNEASNYLFVNGKEIIRFNTKDSEIVVTPLCLGNISKVWSVANMKKTGSNGYVYDFSVDQVRRQIVNVKSNEPVFFSFSIKISKCSGSCNSINYSCAKMCVPDIVKNLNVKAFNLMSRTNETRQIEWHETCVSVNVD